MRFCPRLDVDTWLLSFVAIALYLFVPDPLLAEETGFRIGAHVSLNNQWARYTTPANRNFAAALQARTSSGSIETLPNDRLFHLYRSGELDCILTGGWPHDDPQLVSKHALSFEVRLFTRKDVALGSKDQVLVGRLKQFPPPPLPLPDTMIDWVALQNLKQGFDLLRAGRIDALLADPSHVQNAPGAPHDGIVAADLPPVRRFDVPLLCHDNERNRHFLDILDQTSLTQ